MGLADRNEMGDENMALYDWNGNGKKDMQDNYIEYNLNKNSIGESGNTSGNHSFGRMKIFFAIICMIEILFFLGWITD